MNAYEGLLLYELLLLLLEAHVERLVLILVDSGRGLAVITYQPMFARCIWNIPESVHAPDSPVHPPEEPV